jgi:ribosomal protein S18 acetylase RimI-like enzyme
MKVTAWPTPEVFLAHLGEIDEIAGCVVHGLTHTWLARPHSFRDGTPLLTASLGEQVLAAAVQASAGKVVFSLGPTDAILALAEWWESAGRRPTAVVVPESARAALLHLWPGRATLENTLYRLDAAPALPATPGQLRPARADEAGWLIDWTADFYREANLPDEPKPKLVVETKLKAGHMYVWEDAVPRSIAALAGPTPRSVRINNVYTPEGFRCRGYGSAAVATLAAMQFKNGKQLVQLFADRGRAHTNRMYRKMGFKSVADFVDLAIEPVRS